MDSRKTFIAGSKQWPRGCHRVSRLTDIRTGGEVEERDDTYCKSKPIPLHICQDSILFTSHWQVPFCCFSEFQICGDYKQSSRQTKSNISPLRFAYKGLGTPLSCGVRLLPLRLEVTIPLNATSLE